MGRIIDVTPDEDDEDDSGSGGSKIQFDDSMAPGPSRDDLPVNEKRRKRNEHKDRNRDAVERQKEAIDDIEDRRNNPDKYKGTEYTRESSDYQTHPVLEKMRGQNDPKTERIPANQDPNAAKANPELRKQLQNEFRKTHEPAPKPAPTPTFRPAGM